MSQRGQMSLDRYAWERNFRKSSKDLLKSPAFPPFRPVAQRLCSAATNAACNVYKNSYH
jgi:hypothetical protein